MPKNGFFDCFFQKFVCGAENFAEIGVKGCFARAQKINLVDLKKKKRSSKLLKIRPPSRKSLIRPCIYIYIYICMYVWKELNSKSLTQHEFINPFEKSRRITTRYKISGKALFLMFFRYVMGRLRAALTQWFWVMKTSFYWFFRVYTISIRIDWAPKKNIKLSQIFLKFMGIANIMV